MRLARTVRTRWEAHQQRCQLERELAAYSTPAQRYDLEATFDRYPDSVAYELRDILARQASAAFDSGLPGRRTVLTTTSRLARVGESQTNESVTMGSAGGDEQERLLDEQVSYYRAIAADYLDQGLDLPGGGEVIEALEAFQPTGSVLELACGPGVWTGQLLRHATDVTAVDASPEMLAIAAARTREVGGERVRFIRA